MHLNFLMVRVMVVIDLLSFYLEGFVFVEIVGFNEMIVAHRRQPGLNLSGATHANTRLW